MKKYFLSILIMMVISVTSFSQTTQQKLDEVKKDPKTSENAAKADARLIDKKNVVDSTPVKNTPKRKDSRCIFKRKNKSVHRSS
jgi:Na+-transporting methylmalonyl-CoA/oxaloacetate decarboxylase gamma subunit